MNVSYRWLRSIAPTITDSAALLADRLGMLGAPVDELLELGAELGDVVTARVTEVRPHPNADRLRLCTVDAGGEPLQVVCGAPNVEPGRFYPFVPVGASLPGGVRIRKAKLRGETSEGMLCSARELGLGRDHSGLMGLSGQWQPGGSFIDQLEADDTRLVLDVTPNRPDLLSHLGVARELAPGGDADLRLEPFSDRSIRLDPVRGQDHAEVDGVRVSLDDTGDCPRYMAAVIEGVEIGPSPDWLGMRLRAIGVRPVNNVVDATNYVLHEVGQPLHAFDLDRIEGSEIRVRRAAPGEVLTTLDGVERKLTSEAIVIADRDRPIALAGVMGGQDSEVTENTTRILLECALFDPSRVRRVARSLGLSTDASHRFERGVDPEGLPRALTRVTDLILAIAGGRLTGAVLDVGGAAPDRHRVAVRPEQVHRLLGVEVSVDEITDLLTPIGFTCTLVGGRLSVEVPSYRPDVTREVDVIEEIARRRSYDSFDADLGRFRPGRVPSDPLLDVHRSIHGLFARWGFYEARTAAFAPASDQRVPLLNPLSAEEGHLRDDLAEGLARRVEHNWAHGVRAIRLYEIGSVFLRGTEGSATEEIHLGAMFTGPSRPPHWSGEPPAWDIWDLKALLEEVSELIGGSVAESSGVAGSAFQRGWQFALYGAGGELLGRAGRVDEALLDAPAWAEPVWGLEIALRPAEDTSVVPYRPLPAFPAIERDLALLVPDELNAARVEEVLRARGGELLERVWPFDLYAGEGLQEGTRSIAWRLRFRHSERTLTEGEVEQVTADVVRGLEEELGVRRR